MSRPVKLVADYFDIYSMKLGVILAISTKLINIPGFSSMFWFLSLICRPPNVTPNSSESFDYLARNSKLMGLALLL